ncbi:hypothetical protein [Dokdonella sp.]|uniref:hypothetical protein n=1 Tax=Dokdonella sp. TaxID=2291710 RepID=UPI0037839562
MFRPIIAAILLLGAAVCTARDGDLDLRFDGDGKRAVAFDLSTSRFDHAVATFVDAAGRYTVVGYADYGHVAFARLLPNGAIDAGFGSGGYLTRPLPANATVTVAAKDFAGRIVVGGQAMNPLDEDPFVCRYAADGTPDTQLGPDGCRVVPVDYSVNGDDNVNAIAVSETGYIYLAGSAQRNDTGDYDFFVMRLRETDAAPDSGFGGGDGIQTIAFDLDGNHAGGDDDGATTLLLAGTWLYVGGYAYTNVFSNHDFAIAKINSGSGALDTTFCPNATACTGSEAYQGKRTLSFTLTATRFDEQVRGLKFDRNGYLIMAGTAADNTGADLILARLQTDGAFPAQAFGNEGNHVRGTLLEDLAVGGLAVDFDTNRILVSGSTASAPGSADPDRLLWVGRFLADGTADLSFATVGVNPSWVKAIAFEHHDDAQPTDNTGGALLIDRGRIVLTGSRLWQRDAGIGLNDYDFAVARFEGDAIFIDGLDGY